MPRENSFSDEGRSLTPDLEDSYAPPPATINSGESHDTSTKGSNVRLTVGVLDTAYPSPDPGQTQSAPASVSGSMSRPKFTSAQQRFRETVRKVMAMRRTSYVISRGGVGAEPGIDPRRESANLNFGHIRQKCVIEVADYSTTRSSFGRMTNKEFIKLLEDPNASRREPWVRVRWINVGGLSWDVISALAIKYDIHPLALEDVLHGRGNSRSKADYYPQHLFIRALCHTLAEDNVTQDDSVLDLPRSASPDLMDEDDEQGWGKEHSFGMDDERTVVGSASGSRFSTKRGGMRNRAMRMRDVESRPPQAARFANLPKDDRTIKNARNRQLVRELKRGDRVNVKVQPMCLFLYRDGTVISIQKDASLEFTAPITERLRRRDTGLRMTADASLLVQSLLDLIVDSALEIVEEYQGVILRIEQEVLTRPNMKTVRRLHILQGDLILHKRTLEPIKTVIYGLRRYDVDRVAALSDVVDPSAKIEGFMSHKSKIYLADVHDHIEYILTSIEMFAGVSENLINYTFNMASYEMNEVMRRLTLATIIFLPLTLLTGYFGMNFDAMWSIGHGHTDLVFWIIAIPLMIIVVPLFTYQDLRKMWHYVDKRMAQRKLRQAYKLA